jgi:iron(III) transport system permease protein
MKPFAIVFLLVLFTISIVLPLGSVLIHTNDLGTVQSTVSIITDAISFTTLLAFVAAIICTVIAFFLAHLLVASRSSYIGKILNVICWLPIAIPGTVVGLGFIRTLGAISWLRWIDSFGLFLFLAYVGMFCAFSIRIFYASYMGTDPNVDEAASLDCPHWYHRCWHIDMRMHAGAIVVSLILVFVLSVGELNATVLLCPPGKDTLSVCIDNLLHYGANATASALCLIEAILVLMAIIGCLLVTKMLPKFSDDTTHTGVIHE